MKKSISMKYFSKSISNNKYDNEIIDVAWHSSSRITQDSEIIPMSALDSLSDAQGNRGTHNAIFGLIPSSGIAAPDVAEADDLMSSLHDQYRGALDDPQAVLNVEWMVSAAVHHASPTEAHADSFSRFKSAEAPMSGTHRVEDLFGKLEEDAATLATLEQATPEILRLFAPAESREPMARRPPSLTRREHHAVTLDSPLDCPPALLLDSRLLAPNALATSGASL